jgi:hypothetical protein
MEELRTFLEKAKDDHRLGPVHVSLYAVLFQILRDDNKKHIRREEIMDRAKISGRNTYYNAMHTLHDLGFIEYHPENGPGRTTIRLLPPAG